MARTPPPGAGPGVAPAAGELARPGETPGGPAPPRCDGCRFWVEVVATLGECRRFPPLAGVRQPTAAGPRMYWPLVLAEDWCGEYRPRSPADPDRVQVTPRSQRR